MKTYLLVPFDEKDAAKALGARFDMATKRWYCPDGVDLALFRKWLTVDCAAWDTLERKRKFKRRKQKKGFHDAVNAKFNAALVAWAKK